MAFSTTLRPDSSDDSGGDLNPFGQATSWQALSDNSDSSGTAAQLSSFEPSKQVTGGWGNLPVGVGRVNTCTVRARAGSDIAASANFGMQTPIGVGRISANPVADVITNYSSAPFTTYGTKPLVDALDWVVFFNFVAHPGVLVSVYEIYLDVDWDPAINGLKGMMFSILGPLVAVGLHEMPGLAAELWRRGRTRITPDEYLRAWRELREDRGRRYFVLGRPAPAAR